MLLITHVTVLVSCYHPRSEGVLISVVSVCVFVCLSVSDLEDFQRSKAVSVQYNNAVSIKAAIEEINQSINQSNSQSNSQSRQLLKT